MTAVINSNAMKILEKRYLDGDSVDSMWDRVSGGNLKFRKLMSDLLFLPNSPTLFNMGRNNGCTSSACFVFDVDDTMGPLSTDSQKSIVNTRAKAIAVAKAGGGVGYYFGDLRPRGAPIRSVHRVACGPVTVLKDYQAISNLITQGGKRDLAQMGVLPCWHKDIKEFIHCKDEDPQAFSSFNISVDWTDEWLKAAKTQTGPESELFDEQCLSAWKTGCPGMLFSDRINHYNPNLHLGRINATNPCGETPNRSDEPCNLGSLALPRFFNKTTRSINWDLLEEAVWTATEFLDDILDRNVFPHPNITTASLLTRKLGLGVMGWADLLAMMHIHYDTQEAVNLGEAIMKFISEVSFGCSQSMTREKGPYAGYSDKTNGPCVRNETRTSIAPTGTIALIAGVFGGIEPHFDLSWQRTTKEGLKLDESVYWDTEGFVPKTANEIAPKWHVLHQAAFQKHTCLGVSKTVNLPNTATVADVKETYHLMYDTGCKGGTIFRDGCRSEQVLVKKKDNVFTTGIKKRNLPATRASITHKVKIEGIDIFFTIGLFEDGTPGEIFARASKLGSSMTGMLDSWAINFSIALQNGVPLDTLCRHHEGTRFEPCGLTNNKKIPSCTSVPDYIANWLRKQFLVKDDKSEQSTDSGQYCPECGSEALLQSGCLICRNKMCAWTRCG